MKKSITMILSILLVLSFTTCLAATKIKGITLEKFQTHLTQSAKKYFDYKNVPMVEAEYNTETMED
ncbi:MAG: hypothetical protein VB099_20425, partial [Candidatus Limiplasma sp.]|nr:hypothetical protein [Candidatus Limiplasma sp.]